MGGDPASATPPADHATRTAVSPGTLLTEARSARALRDELLQAFRAVDEEAAARVMNEALGRLENEFRKRQHFLIDAAHELRTPIAIMQTRIDGTAEGQDRRRLLDDVARLAETAEQLLDFERNDQASDLQETVDLVEIARGVVADLAPLAIGAGYQISFQSEIESLKR